MASLRCIRTFIAARLAKVMARPGNIALERRSKEVKVDALDARGAIRTACDGGNTSGSRGLGYPHPYSGYYGSKIKTVCPTGIIYKLRRAWIGTAGWC